MPRQLAAIGVGNAIPFVKPKDIDNQMFYIVGAKQRTNRFGNEEVVFKLRLQVGIMAVDQDEPHKLVQMSLSAGNEGQRTDIVRYFRDANDPLGPCYLDYVPMASGNDFVRINDVTDEIKPLYADAKPRQLGSGRSEYSQESLDDLGF